MVEEQTPHTHGSCFCGLLLLRVASNCPWDEDGLFCVDDPRHLDRLLGTIYLSNFW